MCTNTVDMSKTDAMKKRIYSSKCTTSECDSGQCAQNLVYSNIFFLFLVHLEITWRVSILYNLYLKKKVNFFPRTL